MILSRVETKSGFCLNVDDACFFFFLLCFSLKKGPQILINNLVWPMLVNSLCADVKNTAAYLLHTFCTSTGEISPSNYDVRYPCTLVGTTTLCAKLLLHLLKYHYVKYLLRNESWSGLFSL